MKKWLIKVLMLVAATLIAQESQEALLDRATSWLHQGAWEQAALGFERFLQLFPYSSQRGRAHLGAGQARYMLGNYPESLRHFDRGLQQSPDRVQRRNLLQWKAYLLETIREERQALPLWESALELAITSEEELELQLRVIRNLYLQGSWKEVLDRAESLRLDPTDPRHDFLVAARIDAALQLGDNDRARDLVESVAQIGKTELAPLLEWYRAELQFRKQPEDQALSWDLLASPQPSIARAAAVRLLSQNQDDRQALERLMQWAQAQTHLHPDIMLHLGIRLATLAEREGKPSRHLWQRAWDLRSQTEVGQGILLRLALATAAEDAGEALNLLHQGAGTDLETRLVRWEILGQAGRNREALEEGRRLLREFREHPDRPSWLLRQAILAARLKEWSEVDELASQAGTGIQQSENWLKLLIHVWQSRGQTSEAHRYREKLTALVPDNPAYQADLLRSAISLGHWNQAQSSIQRLTGLSVFRQPPWSHDLVFYRGLLVLREKNLPEADRIWSALPEESALRAELRPQVLFYRAWIDIHLEVPRLASARRRLEVLLRDYPNHNLANPARLLLGRALTLAGEIPRAVEVYQAAARDAERPMALLALGDLNLGLGRRDQARVQLETLAREFPSFRSQARRRLVDIDIPPARQADALLDLHREYPSDPVGQLALFEAAARLSDQDDWARAAPLFEQFARQYSEHERAEAATVLGANAWLKAGKPMEALLLLGLAENLRRELRQRVQIQLLKARAYQELGRYAEAIEALTTLPPEEARSGEVSRQLIQLRLLSQGRDRQEAELLALLENPNTEVNVMEGARLDLINLWLERNSWRANEISEQLRRALASRSSENRSRAELLNGRYLEASGNGREAVEAYLRAVRTAGVPADTAAEALYRAWRSMRSLSPEQAGSVRQTLMSRFPESIWAARARQEAP